MAALVIWGAASSCGAAPRVIEADVEAELRASASGVLQCDAIERIEPIHASRFVDTVCTEREPLTAAPPHDVVATLSLETEAPCTRWVSEVVDAGYAIDAWRASGCGRSATLVCRRGCDGAVPLECVSPDELLRIDCSTTEYRRG